MVHIYDGRCDRSFFCATSVSRSHGQNKGLEATLLGSKTLRRRQRKRSSGAYVAATRSSPRGLNRPERKHVFFRWVSIGSSVVFSMFQCIFLLEFRTRSFELWSLDARASSLLSSTTRPHHSHAWIAQTNRRSPRSRSSSGICLHSSSQSSYCCCCGSERTQNTRGKRGKHVDFRFLFDFSLLTF